MKKINYAIWVLGLVGLIATTAQAQEDLLDELNKNTKAEVFDYPAFKAMKIGNLQSTKVADKGDLYMYVSHRFGSLRDGINTFFGFDNANTKIQLVYGLWNGLQLVQLGLNK